MDLPNKIESILFYLSEPVSIKQLAKVLSSDEAEVASALTILKQQLETRGIRLLEVNETYSLVSAPEASVLIEAIQKEELSKDLSKSALETLSVILYKGAVTRSEIDYVRGVNSTFILRNLLIRGLIEKKENPNDQRSFLYQPTTDLFKYLGITEREQLPKFEEALAQIDGFISTEENKEFAHNEQQASLETAMMPEEDEVTGSTEEDNTLLADVEEDDAALDGYRDEEFEQEQISHGQST